MLKNKFVLLRQVLTVMLSAWLAIAVHLPARSQSDGVELSLEAQRLYHSGQLASAVQAWESAAAAFETQGDRQSLNKSLINQSQVLQDLGLYPRACNTLLKALEVKQDRKSVV